MKDLNVEISLKFDESRLKELRSNLLGTKGLVLNGAMEGIEYLSDLVYERAWAGCPVFTGYLRASMYKETDMDPDNVTANVGHGGKYNRLNIYSGRMTDSYAVEVHETPKIREEGRKQGATWKWLEKAVNSVRPEFEQVLSTYIGAALDGASEGELQGAISNIYKTMNANAKTPKRYSQPTLTDIYLKQSAGSPDSPLLARAKAARNAE